MGFELDRLMKQYGLASPTIAYTGAPTPYKPSEVAADATQTEKDNYATLLRKYNEDLPVYQAAQAAYAPYKAEYQNRLANTPLYLQDQFGTMSSMGSLMPTFSSASNAAHINGTNTAAIMNQSIKDYFASNPTASKTDVQAMMKTRGLNDYDIRNAMGTGFTYGQTEGKSGYGGSIGSNQAQSVGGMGTPAFNKMIQDYTSKFETSTPPTDAEFKAWMTANGVTNKDLYNATGNYWGNILGYKPGAPVTTTCPTGQHLENGVCVADTVTKTCPAGQHLENGVCVKDVVAKTCPAGQHLEGGVCVADTKSCPAGQHLENGICVTMPVTCPVGQHLENGECVEDLMCGEDMHEENGVCVPNKLVCETGYHPENGKCVKDEDLMCGKGMHEEGGVCVPNNLVCDPGFHEENGVCVPNSIDKTCPVGKEWSEGLGKCVSSRVDVCPIGQHFDADGNCVPDTVKPVDCPVGQHEENGVCVPDPIDKTCPVGQEWSEGLGKCVTPKVTACDINTEEYDPVLEKCVPKKDHTCPTGQYWDDISGGCVPIDEPLVCGVGMHEENGVCVPNPIDKTCPVGQEWSDGLGKCVKTSVNVCPIGQHFDADGNCVNDEVLTHTCNTGEFWDPVSGSCQLANQPVVCGVGMHEENGVCVPNPLDTTCPAGQEWSAGLGKCVTSTVEVGKVCNAGFHDENGVCVPDAGGNDNVCGLGKFWDTLTGSCQPLNNTTTLTTTPISPITTTTPTGSVIVSDLTTVSGGTGNDSVSGGMGNDGVGTGPYDYIRTVRTGLGETDPRGIGDGPYDAFGGTAGSGCPAPWINITLADKSLIQAKDIKPGMEVYTRHETTNEWGNYPVEAVEEGEDERWVIQFEDGRQFIGTFNHPVMVKDAWKEIQHLQAGDEIAQPEGVAVVKSARFFDMGTIIKITVKDAHTYLTEGFLSHNKNMVDPYGTEDFWTRYNQEVPMKKGGIVKTHFELGGLNNLSGKYQLGSGMYDPEADAQSQMTRTTWQPTPEISQEATAPLTMGEQKAPMPTGPTGQLDLLKLLDKYQPSSSSAYGTELAQARVAATKESESFNKMLQDAIAARTDNAPSKAEMYFRLAAAFGAPTKTGHFAESLGNVGKTLGEYSKESRDAQMADQALRLQLGIKGQEAKMAAARQNVTDLRTLAGEEMKDKRTIATELIKDYVASGKPQSAAGKQAQDEGLVPGTPSYQKRVSEIADLNVERQIALINASLSGISAAQANLALAQNKFDFTKQQSTKLSPGELKLKTETEDSINQSDQALADLKQAYALNPNTFDNSIADLAQRKLLEAAGSQDPKLLNTRTQENLLAKSAVNKLRVAFGGNPTEGERKILLDLEGIGAKSKEERKAIMQNAFTALQRARQNHAKRLNEINQGLYRDTAPAVGGLE